MATKLHFSPTLGAWTRCKAVNRPGTGVSFCPVFADGGSGDSSGSHFASMADLAASGGGQIHRNGRLTTVTPNTDGTFTASTGKLTRVYNADGTLLKLSERHKQGWSALERVNAENAAVKALIKAGAYDPTKINRLSGVATFDRLLEMDPYEWANMNEAGKAELIESALEDTARRFGVSDYSFGKTPYDGTDGPYRNTRHAKAPLSLFQPMTTTGQTTFYVDNAKTPELALSEELTTTLSNHTAADAIAKEVAHLIEGRAAGHGPAWQRKVRELRDDMGLDNQGNPKALHRKSVFEKEQTRLYAKNQPYMATCAAGKHTFYRKSMDGARGYCGDCYRESEDPNISLSWSENPDAGKWQLTKNGVEKLDAPAPAQKKTRGARIKDWRNLPAIESMEDVKAAMEKMSPELRDNLNGTDYYLRSGWEKTKRLVNPLVDGMNFGPDFTTALLNSGGTFKPKHIEEFRAIVEQKLTQPAAPHDPERWTRRKAALDNYAPDPERLEFMRSLRAKLGLTD